MKYKIQNVKSLNHEINAGDEVHPHLGRADHGHEQTGVGGVHQVVGVIRRVVRRHCYHVAGVQLSKSERVKS